MFRYSQTQRYMYIVGPISHDTELYLHEMVGFVRVLHVPLQPNHCPTSSCWFCISLYQILYEQCSKTVLVDYYLGYTIQYVCVYIYIYYVCIGIYIIYIIYIYIIHWGLLQSILWNPISSQYKGTTIRVLNTAHIPMTSPWYLHDILVSSVAAPAPNRSTRSSPGWGRRGGTTTRGEEIDVFENGVILY